MKKKTVKKYLSAILMFAGVVLSASVQAALVIYEPFDYDTGGLNGKGAGEIGLDGTWSANSTTLIVPGSLSYGTLPEAGNSIGELSRSVNRFGGSRATSSAALADNGLLDNGATLWFSAVMGYGTGGNILNARLALALANSSFNTGNYDYWIKDEGAQLGSGIGVILGNIGGAGKAVATQFRDFASGDGVNGNILGDFSGTKYAAGEVGLIVGKITWGATAADVDTIQLFQLNQTLQKLGDPVSTLTMTVDQSTFDTITFARGDVVVLDEIRFGTTLESVIGDGQGSGASVLIQAELLAAFAALKGHIQGTVPLTGSQIETHKMTIDQHREFFGYNDTIIAAAFDLVDAYDTEIGALFVEDSPIQSFTRSGVSDDDIDWVVFNVMQYIMDYVYTAENIARYEALLDGYIFGSSAHFPGAVTPPADPNATYTVSIDGRFLKTAGHEFSTGDARKPTGAYVAPGSIATVIVPSSLVGQGYQIRVGAYSWDLSQKPKTLRLDRVSLLYDIDHTEVKVANPLGGGIYIEVPYLADAGVVELQIKNTVRAPYFSAKSFHATTLAEWQNTERHHPGPTADFQSEQFMMQVPTSWIYALDDPVTLMEDWEKALEATNELMGYPEGYGKEPLYVQVDLQMRGNAYYPGYPTSNSSYNPDVDYGGNKNHYYLTGPQHVHYSVFHELGHGYGFTKYDGEVESNNNLLHVAVWNQKFGYGLDEAFRESLTFSNYEYRTLETTAIAWMMSENFMLEQPMEKTEKSYQHKGHAKYVDIARLFGWDVLGDHWYSINEDYDNGLPWDKNVTDYDALTLRLCESADVDLRPLLHFWGIQPMDAAALDAEIAAANVPASRAIYNTLLRYQSLVPADNSAYQDFAYAWWGDSQPSSSGYQTETDHASIWNSYDTTYAAQVETNVQNILDLYFPEGAPIEIRNIDIELLSGSSELAFSWFGENGQTYGLEWTEDLVSKDWKTVTNVVGTNGIISLTDEMDKTNAFYRVFLAE